MNSIKTKENKSMKSVGSSPSSVDHSTSSVDVSGNAVIRVSIPTLKIESLIIPKEIKYFSELKEYIYELYEIPPNRQKWIFNKRLVKDDDLHLFSLDSMLKKDSRDKKRNIIRLTLIGSVPTSSTLKHLTITDCLKHVMNFCSLTELKRIQYVSKSWFEIVRHGSILNLDRYYWICHSTSESTRQNDAPNTLENLRFHLGEELDLMEDDEFEEFDEGLDDEFEEMMNQQISQENTASEDPNLEKAITCLDLLTGAIVYKIPDVQKWCNNVEMGQRHRKMLYTGTEHGIIVRDNILEVIYIPTGITLWTYNLSTLRNDAIDYKISRLSTVTDISPENRKQEYCRILLTNQDSIYDFREQSAELRMNYEAYVNRMLTYLDLPEPKNIFGTSDLVKSQYDKVNDRIYVQFKTILISIEATTGKLDSTYVPFNGVDNILGLMSFPFILLKGMLGITIIEASILLLSSSLQPIKLVDTNVPVARPYFEDFSEEYGQIFVMCNNESFTIISSELKKLKEFSSFRSQISENYLINLQTRRSLDLDTIVEEKIVESQYPLHLAYEHNGYIRGFLTIDSHPSSHMYSNPNFETRISKMEIEKGIEHSSFQYYLGRESKIVEKAHVIWKDTIPCNISSVFCQFMPESIIILGLFEKPHDEIYNSLQIVSPPPSEYQRYLIRYNDNFGTQMWKIKVNIPLNSEIYALEVIHGMIFIWWGNQQFHRFVDVYNSFGDQVYSSLQLVDMAKPVHIVRDAVESLEN